MRQILVFIVVCLCLTDAGAQGMKVKKSDLKELYKFMQGTFSSEKQSAQDSNFFHIMLRMVPLWKKDKEGYWLYVEQATASAEDKPYRQRIYHLYLQDDYTIASKVYEVENVGALTGAWKDLQKLDMLTKDRLLEREGCTIYLKKLSKHHYKGSTPGNSCISTLRGASYATSEVEILKDRMITWDRGWNADGKQVWGSDKGGYIFMKIK